MKSPAMAKREPIETQEKRVLGNIFVAVHV